MTVSKPTTDQRGFILVTSLIFLVVLTLLAVTAISSATLQQRMAANQQDKAAALDRANSALAYVGQLLSDKRLTACQPLLGGSAASAAVSCPSALRDLPIRLTVAGAPDTPGRYLADAFWTSGPVATYSAAADTPATTYVIEAMAPTPVALNARPDRWRFRVTARAMRQSTAVRAVAQMIYEVAR